MFTWRGFLLASAIAGSAGPLGGCGTYTPDIELTKEPHATAFLINKIVDNVKCELRTAVRSAITYDKANAAQQPDKKRHLQWLEGMAAKVSLKLIVDEKGTLNPGITFKQLLPSAVNGFPNKSTVTTPQSRSLGLGALLSSDATRTENVDYTFVIKTDFLENQGIYTNAAQSCVPTGDEPLEGDLKVQDWLDGVTFPFYLPNNVDNVVPDVLTHEVEFVVVASGNITPSWSLVQVSANTAASLAAAGRTNTGDLIISLGPAKGTSLQDAHDIAKINSGFTSALKNTQN
jgi:hypothetical protein